MVKRLIYFCLLFVFGIWYLERNGYIILTPKAKKEMDEKYTKAKIKAGEITRKTLKTMVKKGSELVVEVLEERNEEKN